MAIQLSPGVAVNERDLTNVIPAASTSIGAFCGNFGWGAVDEVLSVGGEVQLANIFGKPNLSNTLDFHTAAYFLRYGNNLKVVRSIDDQAANASTPSKQGKIVFKNEDDMQDKVTAFTLDVDKTETVTKTVDIQGLVVAEDFTPKSGSKTTIVCTLAQVQDEDGFGDKNLPIIQGRLADQDLVLTDSKGNKFNVKLDDSSNFLVTGQDPFKLQFVASKAGSVTASGKQGDKLTLTVPLLEKEEVTPVYPAFVAKYPGKLGNSLSVIICPPSDSDRLYNSSEFSIYKKVLTGAPDTTTFTGKYESVEKLRDEVHIVVLDRNGEWTGQAGTVLEVHPFVSLFRNSKTVDGASNYYIDVVNRNSQYMWVGSGLKPLGFSFAGEQLTSKEDYDKFLGLSNKYPESIVHLDFTGGVDVDHLTPKDLVNSYALFDDVETQDISLLICPTRAVVDSDFILEKKLVSIVESRKDCVAFISPPTSVTTASGKNTAQITNDIIAWCNNIPSSSYVVLDSSAIKVYDKYNDNNIYICASSSVAGLCANTDDVADPWFSPAGFNRGGLRDVIRIAFNPRKNDRDNLYINRINPIVSFPGEGILLYGDKTALSKPSAFDRINVRRLFIVLEKAISKAAKYQLFELNDEFTRAQFRSMIEPFLRDVQGRRGITDFRVVCDETNNTPEVIDTNRFAGDIYIKPERSINFIQLNFIAVRTGVSFSELAGGGQ